MPESANQLSPLPGIIGAGVGAVGNVVSSLITNASNRQLAEEARRWSLEQWNRENAYNLPVNQVRRLKDAGLNPALMYANGTSSLQAATSPEVTTSKNAAPQVDPLLAAQVANINADTALKKADAGQVSVETRLKNIEFFVQDYLKNSGGLQTMADNLVRNNDYSTNQAAYESLEASVALFALTDSLDDHPDLGLVIDTPDGLKQIRHDMMRRLISRYGKSLAYDIQQYDLFSDYYRAMSKEYKNQGAHADIESVALKALNSLAQSDKWYSKALGVLLLKLYDGDVPAPVVNIESHRGRRSR